MIQCVLSVNLGHEDGLMDGLHNWEAIGRANVLGGRSEEAVEYLGQD